MKKIFGMLLVLFSLFYGYQYLFLKLSKGHNVYYEIKDEMYNVKINEVYRSNLEEDDNNYYITFDVYGDKFYSSIYEDFKGSSNIVKKVRYFLDNEYSCLFVQYESGKVLSDVMCKKDGIFLPFNTINNPSNELVDFIATLAKEGYLINNFRENIDESYTMNNLEIHKSNLQSNHIIGLYLKNNLYVIKNNDNKNPYEVLKYSVDNFVSYYFNNYYIIGNYNYNNDGKIIIDGINVYNLKNNEKTYVKFENTISSDTYFIGEHLNSVYFYDPISHIEYELNINDKQIIEVGNKDTSIKYIQNGEWKRVTYDDFELENIRFDEKYKSDIFDEQYSKIYKIGNDYGFYYLLKKVNNQYEVYRTAIGDLDNKTFLFSTTNQENLVFLQNGVYYQKADKIMYYSDKTNNRTIISGSELLNNYNKIGAFIN